MTDDPSNPALPPAPAESPAPTPDPAPPAVEDAPSPELHDLIYGRAGHIDAFVQLRMENHLAEAALLARHFMGGPGYDIEISRQRYLSVALKIFTRTAQRYRHLGIRARVRALRRARRSGATPPVPRDPTP